jgi:RimJ/RimL family protein N-acetyltransferase
MIETARLILREWREEDRAPFLELCASAVVMEHLGGPRDAGEVDAAIDRMGACQAEHGHCFWAMERKADGAFLGFCGLKRGTIDPIMGWPELGWRMRQEAWGHGYAREAAAASLAWGWANLSDPRIVAITVPANRRSWGLMERIGLAHRPELDFGHPDFPEDHPLHPHITYAAERPTAS